MNYLEYFGLQQEPFSNTPAMKFFYNSAQHSTALLRIMHAIEGMRGLALVLGQAGKGKTTLARRVLEQLSPEVYQAALIVVVHASVEPEWFLKKIARQLGIEDTDRDKVDLLSDVSERLMQIQREGRKTVVLIDEAQMLRSREILEEMRGLLNIETGEQKLITFVLFGLPDLDEVLDIDPPLKQRVATRVRLENLSREGTAQYVRHRLRLAGTGKAIFEADALDQLFLYTRGNPRLINTMCDNLLLEAFLLGRDLLDRSMVDAVAQDLGLTATEPPAGTADLSDELEFEAEAAPPDPDDSAQPEAVAEPDLSDLDLAGEDLADEDVASAYADPTPSAVPEGVEIEDELAGLIEDFDDAEAAGDPGESVPGDVAAADESGPADDSVDLQALVADDDAEDDLGALLSEFEETGDRDGSAGEAPAAGDDSGSSVVEDAADEEVDALLADLDSDYGSIEVEADSVDDAASASLADDSDADPDVDALLADLGDDADGDDDDDLLIGAESGDSSSHSGSGEDELEDLLADLGDDVEIGGDDESGLEIVAGDDDAEVDALLGELGAEDDDADAEVDALLADLDDNSVAATADDDGSDAELDALLSELGDEDEVGEDNELDALLADLDDASGTTDSSRRSAETGDSSELDDLLSEIDALGDA